MLTLSVVRASAHVRRKMWEITMCVLVAVAFSWEGVAFSVRRLGPWHLKAGLGTRAGIRARVAKAWRLVWFRMVYTGLEVRI